MPWYDDFTSRPRIRVEGGIKLKSRQGQVGAQWWSQRWLEALEKFTDRGRLQRGRSYARAGQVMDMHVAPGEVKARVQGSMPQPYRVNIKLKPLSDGEWMRVIDAMAAQATFAAKLLASEMPEDIERAFDAAKAPLFPTHGRDLDPQCSCPDAYSLCKHIAAVYYILAEQFDEDPFLIFTLRGRNKDEIMAELRKRRAKTAQQAAAVVEEAEPADADPPLEAQLENFWRMGDLTGFQAHPAPPDVPGAVVRSLGRPAIGAEGSEVYDRLMRMYAQAARRVTEM